MRYYESDAADEIHDVNEYVCADAWIDPEGEDLPLEHHHEVVERMIEIRAMQEVELRGSCRLLECNEEQNIEAEDMAKNMHQPSEAAGTQATCGSGNAGQIEGDKTLGEALLRRNTDPLSSPKNDDMFKKHVKDGYLADKLFSAILEKLGDYKLFSE